MIYFNQLRLSIIIIPGMPLTKTKRNYGLARFSVLASQTWGAIPMKIKCLPFNNFKKEYKLSLLDSGCVINVVRAL